MKARRKQPSVPKGKKRKRGTTRSAFTEAQRDVLKVMAEATKILIRSVDMAARHRIEVLVNMLHDRGVDIDWAEFDAAWRAHEAAAYQYAVEITELETVYAGDARMLEGLRAIQERLARLRNAEQEGEQDA